MIPIPSNNRWDQPALDAALVVFERIAAAHDQQLVRMKMLDSPAPYEEGKIYGLPASAALEYYRWQLAIPVTPEGNPLEDVPLNEKVEVGPRRETAGLVEIPEDWESSHHLRQMRIAAEIMGQDVKGLKLERAQSEIRNELQRRKDDA